MVATRTNLPVRYPDPELEFFLDSQRREIVFRQDPMPWQSLDLTRFSRDERICDCLQVPAPRLDFRCPTVISHSGATRARKQDRRENSITLQASHRTQFDTRNSK